MFNACLQSYLLINGCSEVATKDGLADTFKILAAFPEHSLPAVLVGLFLFSALNPLPSRFRSARFAVMAELLAIARSPLSAVDFKVFTCPGKATVRR